MWEFPGGKQDPGESLEACLKRELTEELGINARVGEKIGTFDHTYTHFRITVHAYFFELISGTPKPLDHVELAWVKPHQFLRYPMGKVDRAIARKVTELLS